MLHDRLVVLNKPNNSPKTHGSDGRLRRETPTRRVTVILFICGSSEARDGAGTGRGGALPVWHPQAPLCVYLPLHGTDAVLSSKANWP
ncbi:hypothetical protein CgunFtcFv8_006470 [Champsocephalus gunnari]|uniref:Uncharacterized protein n=1 Tax=Champsocephalus gunnari TaxID=52237 RepID=A0AAN8C0C8_CHAGU|nr:hypothetical protein CgunFtcFv8_006470 [Champsocephalus gunnari]